MGFGKPFRAVPLKVVPGGRSAPPPRRRLGGAAKVLGAAALFGLGAGALAAADAGAFPQVTSTLRSLAVSQGLVRRRAPAPGDYWRGCNAARAAGVTPLRAGEPGYRAEMDGDGDGIACEPYRGR
jgi:hypothetical protein